MDHFGNKRLVRPALFPVESASDSRLRCCLVAPSAESLKTQRRRPSDRISETKKSWLFGNKLARLSGRVNPFSAKLSSARRVAAGKAVRDRAWDSFYFYGTLSNKPSATMVRKFLLCCAHMHAYSTISREASLFAGSPSAAIVQ